MSTTQQTAERAALQGLLLLLVEAQSTLQAARVDPENLERGKIGAFHELEKLVDGAHAAELVQLARAALDVPAAVREATEGPCDDVQPDRVTSTMCTRCAHPVMQHVPRAIPAAAASTHV